MIRTGNFPCRLLQSLRLLLVVPVDPVFVVVVRVGDDVAADVVGDSVLQLRVGLSYSDTHDQEKKKCHYSTNCYLIDPQSGNHLSKMSNLMLGHQKWIFY